MWVDPERLPPLHDLPRKRIDDRYMDGGRLRLRKITASDGGETVYKLCKKYGSVGPYQEPIANLYLTADEYKTLLALPGCNLTKFRYHYEYGGYTFSIDEHTGPHTGLYLCEREAPTVCELLDVPFPPFATDDVTGNPEYMGAYLARQGS